MKNPAIQIMIEHLAMRQRNSHEVESARRRRRLARDVSASGLKNQPINRSSFAVGLLGIMAFLLLMPTVLADSAIDLVAGFDEDRIEKVFPLRDQEAVSEAAKLLYRIGNVNPESFTARHPAGSDANSVGEAVEFDGEFDRAKLYSVPETLRELLGFDSLAVITLNMNGDQSISVITRDVPVDCKLGDRLTVIGMVVQPSEAVVAAKLSWYPRNVGNPSWQWLADHGVDIAQLPGLKNRDRRSLGTADTEVFYSMLVAAAGPAPWPTPLAAEPIDLLSDPNSLVARFITLPVEVIQVTRVSVTDVRRMRQLGSDHYFQIDTVGDLGNVVVRIEPASDDTGDDPAIFENRYPVSIVMRELPEFLKKAIRVHEGGDAVVSDVNMRVQVNGFFFRLWSYETDYMKQFGDEKQFGPLLIAAEMRNLQSDSADPLGVGVIGSIAAVVIGVSMAGIFFWHRWTSAGDARAQRRRREKSSGDIDWSS
jgi:hypothetical protein